MEDFSFLPKSGIIFLDNCVFGIKLRPWFSRNELNKDRNRFKNLQETLTTRNNWLVIPEIIKEFKKGNDYLYGLKEEISNSRNFENLTKDKFSFNKTRKIKNKNNKKLKLCKFTRDYISERRKFLSEHLEEDFRDATGNLKEKRNQRVKELIELIEPLFVSNGGKPNELNTDCKLIATALTYAETKTPSKEEYTYIYSYDLPLSQTFADATRKLNLTLENTYIIKLNKTIVPCWKYQSLPKIQYS